MESIFAHVESHVTAEEQLRDELRQLRAKADSALQPPTRLLQSAHREVALPDKDECVRLLGEVGRALHAMMAKLPAGSYYKYCGLFNSLIQSASFVAVMEEFLCSKPAEPAQLPDMDQVRLLLQLPDEDPFHIEDYLVGVCSAISELSRLCVTRVTLGDFEFARRVSVFANEVFAGFQQLNFRNDFLRRKYDGMKYDVKRIEDVVYDLTVRQLLVPLGN